MDSDQDLSECPLCLEVLEADDLSFFPCTCCYQICRFCWHRIRTDENGLCPACRKPFSENPAQFKPLSEEEIQQVKRDRKFKDSNKKPKITESRKHLTNLRVVQRNLVFVNGLPSRLADTELLRRNDHFGKYGKIVKLVTSPAHNGQLNSICVYITYARSEEALRAIQALCNYHVDGRTLKATLGTTKYCSRYLKGAVCQKTDCLYLHEPGDPLASFTKEQMQQGLHLDYERKLMDHFSSQAASGTSKGTTNGHKNDSSQKRPSPLITPLLTTTNDIHGNLLLANGTNGNSDLESGDEVNSANTASNHHLFNGLNNETFTSTTAINGDTLNGDSDASSTSSQTSSEHDPSSRGPLATLNVSPSTNWPGQTSSLFPTTNLLASNQPTNSSSSISPSVTALFNGNSQSRPNDTTQPNSTVKHPDHVPEYKLFGSNTPSIHTLFFGTNENTQSRAQSHYHGSNGIDHDLEDLEKRLSETDLVNGHLPSFLQTQESDELGFDPCSLFMSALASDIEDERRPTPHSSTTYHSTLNSYGFSSQYHPNMNNPSIAPNPPSWMVQQQQQQQYPSYHEQPSTPQKQQRYQHPFNGSSPRQMWNGNQQQQYPSHTPTRLEFTNQIQHPQRLAPQPSSPQYPPSINQPYPSNGTVNTTNNNNLLQDRWINMSRGDAALVSLGNKLDPMPGQWSNTALSQGPSTLSSGNNLMSTSRWSQSPSQSHMLTNGMYMPYSTTSTVDDGSRP